MATRDCPRVHALCAPNALVAASVCLKTALFLLLGVFAAAYVAVWIWFCARSPSLGNWDTIGQLYSYVRCIIFSDHITDADFQVRGDDAIGQQIQPTNCSPNNIDTVYPDASFEYSSPPRNGAPRTPPPGRRAAFRTGSSAATGVRPGPRQRPAGRR